MWNPPIVPTVATENKGIEDLAAAIASYYDHQKQENGARERKTAIARWRLTELLQDRLLNDLMNKNGAAEKLENLAAEIAEKKIDPYTAVETLVS
jgi:LAO/AO transport system kinase